MIATPVKNAIMGNACPRPAMTQPMTTPQPTTTPSPMTTPLLMMIRRWMTTAQPKTLFAKRKAIAPKISLAIPI
jgi:hypothetical protein